MTPDTITISFAAFFAFLALLVFLRLLLRKGDPNWRHIRIGVFVEREERGDE